MFKNLGPTEVIIIGVILLVLLGSKRLNVVARGLGESKKEINKLQKELTDSKDPGA